MNNKNIFTGVLVIVLLIGAYFLGVKTSIAPSPVYDYTPPVTTKSTTTNGVVEKPTNINPNNNKPTPKPITNNYIKIGQKILLNGVNITPTKVAYDNRCPKDVQCIQAGTVELGVILESGSLSQNVIITLDKPFYFAERQITLTSVTPSKIYTKTIKESEYRFTISVK